MPCPEASCISPSDCYNGKCETAHGPSWCLAPGTSQGQKDKVNTLLAKREGVTSKQESGSHSMLTTQVAAWRGIAPGLSSAAQFCFQDRCSYCWSDSWISSMQTRYYLGASSRALLSLNLTEQVMPRQPCAYNDSSRDSALFARRPAISFASIFSLTFSLVRLLYSSALRPFWGSWLHLSIDAMP